MSPDPHSNVDAPLAPPPPALTPGTTFAQYVAATVDEPQPAWRTLNAARESAFTGEIRFESSPSTVVYADAGVVYFAEHAGDEPVGRWLVAEGAITTQQLSRGTMHVGDAEHLGRLFDRDPSIDRDAVLRLVEAKTEAIVAELAASTVASVAVTAFRHHPSGIHRWFVAPYDLTRPGPLSDVAQVDRSVIDDLPPISQHPPELRIEWDEPTLSGDVSLADDASFEGHADHDPFHGVDISAELESFDADQADWSSPKPSTKPSTPQTEPGQEMPPPSMTVAGSAGAHPMPDPVPAEDDRDDWLGDFQIVWPDGTEEPALPVVGAGSDDQLPMPDPEPGGVPSVDPEPTAEVPSGPITMTPSGGLAPPSSPLTTPTDAEGDLSIPAAVQDTDVDVDVTAMSSDSNGPVYFDMPALVVDGAPDPDAQVPEDVADAVRRALKAIENAATNNRPASLPQIDLEPITMPDLRLPSTSMAPPVTDASEPTPSSPAPPVDAPLDDLPSPVVASPTEASPIGDVAEETEQDGLQASTRSDPAIAAPVDEPASQSFAPPVPEMRAEAIYARAAAAAVADPDDGSTSDSSATEPPVGAEPSAGATPEAVDSSPGGQVPGDAVQEPGRASVVFLDDDDDNEDASRKGALRRLIGSLRKSA